MVKRGGSSQPQAVGSQKKSKVGSNITPSSQERKKFFDSKTETGDPNEPGYAASSSSVGSRKRTARRGRGRQRLKLKLRRLRPTDRTNPRPPGQRGREIRPHSVLQYRCYLAGMTGEQDGNDERKLPVRAGPEADQSLLTMLWMTPTWRQVMPGEDRPQVSKTMENDVVRLGAMRDKEDDLGVPTPRLRERMHHAHRRDLATHLRQIILRLRHDGTTATMRRSESFVRTLGTAPGKYGSILYTLWARPVVATETFHYIAI
jgi:hypothetical protein